jgi:hypothetical protein
MPYRKIAILVLILAAQAALADIKAVTVDGRQVTLREDGTWTFSQAGDDAEDKHLARLSLENKVDLARGCRLGLRLNNELPEQIRTLVLRFTAVKSGGIEFDTVSRGFSYIKPTASQYQEIDFRGITCAEISIVDVSAARNCHIGELTKYSASAENCLKLIEVAPSSLLPIAKADAH